jgi:peroxiredoxin
MKMLHRLLTFAALVALTGPITLSAKAVVGQAAPDFSLTDLDGKTHRLSDFKGKTVVLEWVNPECPFVGRHYSTGNMPGLQKSATADDVVWLTINSASPKEQGDYAPDKAKGWMKKVSAAPTAYLRDSDGKVGKAYDAKTTPHMFVINPEGKLVYEGAIDDSPRGSDKAQNYVTAALTAVKSGGMPEKTNTKPYGCNVKY